MNGTSRGFMFQLRAWGIAFEEARGLIAAMVMTWLMYPVMVVTTVHWQDAAGLPFYVRGELIPRFFSTVTMNRAGAAILAAWLLLLLATFVLTVKFYRRVQLPLPLWPMCFVTVAGLGNFGWFFYKGFFDAQGAIAGTAPVVVLAIYQLVCDRLGAGFVFGGSAEA